MPSESNGRPRALSRIASGTYFYLAASLYAAVALPWSVLAIAGLVSRPQSLALPLGHAHEMLLGYALAVVAGNQLGALSPMRLRLILAAWLLARVAYVASTGAIAAAFDIVFICALGMHAAPRLFRAAKKLRNQALPAILTALCVGAIAFDVAAFVAGVATEHAIVVAIVLVLAALMLFMGGRIIAPAAAGQFYRQGSTLEARVQPRIEAAIIVAIALAVVAAPIAQLMPVMRLACAVTGALAFVRLLRWRLWACKKRPDLWCLGAGYAWLAAGLLALAVAAPSSLRTAALHLVTVGALGTLTFNVMATMMLTRARLDCAGDHRLGWGTVLIGLATAGRVAAALVPAHAVDLLVVAAACWSAAFLLSTWILIDAQRVYARRPRSEFLPGVGRDG
ncbi:MAG: hypothetical protein LKCHEGNO_02318 [Burkholderiaceae bacterium]|nr:hypothetical protein [Burkholderiaceae bacterium]